MVARYDRPMQSSRVLAGEDLHRPIRSVLPNLARGSAGLARLGVTTPREALWYLPFRYDDFSSLQLVRDLVPEEKQSARVRVESVRVEPGFGKRPQRVIAQLSDEIDLDGATAVWEAALRAPGWAEPPVWVHGDLDRRNLLTREGRLAAVVDFGCVGAGDPACDVAVAWKVLSPETRDGFRGALAVDEATWARARGWAVSQALGALAYYTGETNPTLVAEARRWLADALA